MLTLSYAEPQQTRRQDSLRPAHSLPELQEVFILPGSWDLCTNDTHPALQPRSQYPGAHMTTNYVPPSCERLIPCVSWPCAQKMHTHRPRT